jgi:hypothetical protein
MASNLALKEEMTEGLGSFALGEADAEAYFAEEVDSGGIADLGAIRERMARAGRFDDDHVGHLATGELVVPAPLLEKLPELRESILGHLREMGVEDPERYIVGNKLNSVNPETGMVEFGFFSSIGKAFKSIGKVLKKAAPLIITAALAATGVGAIAAGMIGSGLGTLINGGSMKDALISSAIGGITGGLAPSIGDIAAQGLGGMAQAAVAGGDMKDILSGGAMGAASAGLGKFAKANFAGTKLLGYDLGIKPELNADGSLASTFDLIGKDLGTTGDFASSITSGNVSKAFAPSGKAFNDEFGNVFGTNSGTAAPVSGPAPKASTFGPQEFINSGIGDMDTISKQITGAPESSTWAGRRMQENFPETRASALSAVNDPVGYAQDAFTGAKKITGIDILNSAPHVPADVQAKFAASAKAQGPGGWSTSQQSIANLLADSSSPGFIGRNPLLAAVGAAGGIGALAYGMDDEQPKTESPGVLPGDFSPGGPSQEAIAANRLANISGNPDALKPLTFPNRLTLVNAPVNEDLRRRFPDIFAAADGGGVFPRRTGGIMPNEGIPGQDSVRAMVMPGEFIFTTDAVRGASPDGSLNGGINNMYSVMRNLETRGRRMA